MDLVGKFYRVMDAIIAVHVELKRLHYNYQRNARVDDAHYSSSLKGDSITNWVYKQPPIVNIPNYSNNLELEGDIKKLEARSNELQNTFINEYQMNQLVYLGNSNSNNNNNEGAKCSIHRLSNYLKIYIAHLLYQHSQFDGSGGKDYLNYLSTSVKFYNLRHSNTMIPSHLVLSDVYWDDVKVHNTPINHLITKINPLQCHGNRFIPCPVDEVPYISTIITTTPDLKSGDYDDDERISVYVNYIVNLIRQVGHPIELKIIAPSVAHQVTTLLFQRLSSSSFEGSIQSLVIDTTIYQVLSSSPYLIPSKLQKLKVLPTPVTRTDINVKSTTLPKDLRSLTVKPLSHYQGHDYKLSNQLELLERLDLLGDIVYESDLLARMVNLKYLILTDAYCIQTFPFELLQLPHLIQIKLVNCQRFVKLPNMLGELRRTLKVLEIIECPEFVSLPNTIGDLDKLVTLNVSGCEQLEGIPSVIGLLDNLQKLDIRGCDRIQSLPEPVYSMNLVEFHYDQDVDRFRALESRVRNRNKIIPYIQDIGIELSQFRNHPVVEQVSEFNHQINEKKRELFEVNMAQIQQYKLSLAYDKESKLPTIFSLPINCIILIANLASLNYKGIVVKFEEYKYNGILHTCTMFYNIRCLVPTCNTMIRFRSHFRSGEGMELARIHAINPMIPINREKEDRALVDYKSRLMVTNDYRVNVGFVYIHISNQIIQNIQLFPNMSHDIQEYVREFAGFLTTIDRHAIVKYKLKLEMPFYDFISPILNDFCHQLLEVTQSLVNLEHLVLVGFCDDLIPSTHTQPYLKKISLLRFRGRNTLGGENLLHRYINCKEMEFKASLDNRQMYIQHQRSTYTPRNIPLPLVIENQDYNLVDHY